MPGLPPPPPHKPQNINGSNNNEREEGIIEENAFSVSAARALFEAAKKPEIQRAATAVAKNPVLRNAAINAAKDPTTRNAALSYMNSTGDSKPAPPKKFGGDDAPPPPPPHRGGSTAAVPPPKPKPVYKEPSFELAPPAPSISSYNQRAPPLPPKKSPTQSQYPSLVDELKSLHVNTSGPSYTSSAPSYSAHSDVVLPPKPTRPPPPKPSRGGSKMPPGNVYSRCTDRSPSPVPFVEMSECPPADCPVMISSPAECPVDVNQPSDSSSLETNPLPDFIPEIVPDSIPLEINLPESTGPHAIVRYPFAGSQPDELNSEVDDTILLKKEVDDQWIYGLNTRTGKQGIIPFGFIEVKVPLAPSSTSHSAVALYDYFSNTPGDLQFRANDTIQVKEWASPEWLLGSLFGQTGIFPANYVSCPSLQSVPKGATYNSVPAGPIGIFTAVYDYNSGVPGDLVFQAGDQIEVLEYVGQDWVRGRLYGQEGILPFTYVSSTNPKKSPSGLASISSIATIPARLFQAMDDHHSDDASNLYFSKGDRLIIVEEVDGHFYRGKLEEFRTLPPGLVPRSKVVEL